MYSERASVVRHAVAWSSTGPGPSRILPDGCMDLLWLDEKLVVAGPDRTAYVSGASTSTGVVGLRFASGVAPAWLGVPAVELCDRRVELAAIWPGADVRRLTERVASASDPLVALETVIIGRARSAPPDRVMREVCRLLHGGMSVGPVADRVGLSERQLHRRALVAYGYGPKTLARIQRLDRALTLARTGVDFASCAHRVGYVDQAHLARDVRDLTGTTLLALVKDR